MSDSPVRFDVVALDAPDPVGLARFYCDLLGWQVQADSDDEWVTIRRDSGSGESGEGRLAFQRAPDFVAPTWPDPAVPQQAHVDLAGHPFCLCLSVAAVERGGPQH